MDTQCETLLTTGDAARIADVVPATVILAANAGRLPVAARTRNGNRLFRQEDVRAFAEVRKAGRVNMSVATGT